MRRLDIATVDASGRALRLTTTPTAHVAVASHVVRVGWGPASIDMVLDVLSASHRVRATHVGSGQAVHETVACALRDVDDRAAGGHATGDDSTRDESAGDHGAGVPASECGLPITSSWRSARWRVEFDSAIESGDAALRCARGELERALRGNEGIAVAFPGADDAITALAVRPLVSATRHLDGRLGAGVTWLTWHLYPGDDPHVVRTRSRARWA